MTRINVVPPSELCRQHLVAEYREITRVFGQRRNAIQSRRKLAPPKEYTLGAGHVTFFTDKLGYVLERYHQLQAEMRARGYTVNAVPDQDLTNGIDSRWFGQYTPTPQAVEINRQRIKERMPK